MKSLYALECNGKILQVSEFKDYYHLCVYKTKKRAKKASLPLVDGFKVKIVKFVRVDKCC
jgi:hypothetical protein